MKIEVEIVDALLAEATRVAAEDGTTIEALRRHLRRPRRVSGGAVA